MTRTKKTALSIALMLVLSFFLVAEVDSTPLVWSSDHSLPGNSLAIDEASSIIQTSDGKMWVVWDKDVPPGHAIYYSTSSDYGLTWSPATNLTTIPDLNVNVDPSIVQLSNGTILVMWSSQRPPPLLPSDFAIQAIPSSLTVPVGSSRNSTIEVTSLNGFNGPVSLSVKMIPFNAFVYANLNPWQITPPPNGHVNSTFTVWVDPGANLTQNYYFTVTGRGPPPLNLTHSTLITVTPTTTLSASGASDSVSLFSDPAQTGDNFTLYGRSSNDFGATWGSEFKIPFDDYSHDNLAPSIMQAANGTIWLAWTSTRVSASNSEIFYKTSPDGVTWSQDVRLTFNSSTDARPSIAQMQDGRIWIAWHSKRYDSNEELIYNIYNGTAWLGETRLTNNTLLDTGASILQSQDGVIRIFWARSPPLESNDIYFVESTDNGVTWSSPILFPTDGWENVYPSVTQSVDSRIWVLRTTNKTGNWDIFYKTSLVHNVAVIGILPAVVKVYQEEVVPVNVTVENQGDYNEPSVIVSLYANTTFVGTQTVSVNSRAVRIVPFAWNTAGFARGNYSMTALVTAVSGEVYFGDNTITDGSVKVKLLGDVDDNRLVEVRDLWALGKAYGSAPGSPNWNVEADFNADSMVNRTDLSGLSRGFGAAG